MIRFQLAMTACFLLPALTAASGQAPAYPFRNTALTADQRIENLVSLMTMDEKIACLGVNTAVPRLGVPNIGNSEGIHGVVQRELKGKHSEIKTTQFPQPPGMGESWDPDLVRKAAEVEGNEARYITETPRYNRQLLMLWGPQADLARDPRWGRGEEVYGEDPFLDGTMVTAFVKGLQGDDPRHWQVAALLKHFVANSNEDFRNVSSSDFDQRLFWEYYSVPFRMGFLDGGAKAVMASYNAWNGTPMAVNPVLTTVVRDQWGADVISSDGRAVGLLWKERHLFASQKAAVVACLKAGINQFLDEYVDETKSALADGSVTPSEIDALVKSKFRIALRLGLLDPQEVVPYSSIKDSPEPWNTEKSRSVSRRMALESVVLLKNDRSFLPLDKAAIKNIAVIGPLANVVRRGWYGGVPPYAVTPLQGIKEAAGSAAHIVYAEDNTANAAINAARGADVAVVVVGNDPTCGPDMADDWYNPLDGSGGTYPCSVASDGREGRDRESITLEQEQLVKQVYAVNPKTVVVLISSFPFAINWSEAHVPAIVHMVHSSQDEGTALSSVLFGDYNPAGRLVETWPTSLEQLPPMMDYDIRHGKTYMYFKGKPLYPFGFGLSYTSFAYSNLRTSSPTIAADGVIQVSVDVKNTGMREGDDVVQLYVGHPEAKVQRPQKELAGFQRVSLKPNETKTVVIPLKAANLAWWDQSLPGFRIDKERLSLMVGQSSENILLTGQINVE